MSSTNHSLTTDQKIILIVGGTGFLGSHISDAFSRDSSYTVVVSSRRPNRHCLSNATWMGCDVTKSSDATRLIESVKPIVIIHAATPGPFATIRAQMKHYEGTSYLLEEAKKSQFVRGFIYTGSRETIANGLGVRPPGLKEKDAIFHTFFSGPTPYARSKGACQSLVMEYNSRPTTSRSSNKAADLEWSFQGVLFTTIICVPGIYGPRDTGITPGVFKLPNRIRLGPNECLHDWVYVENAAFAYVLAAKGIIPSQSNLEPTMRVDGELFFITDGEPINFWEFARAMKVEAGDQVAGDTRNIFVVPWFVVLLLATISEWVYWVFTLGRIVSSFNPNLARYIKDGGALDISKAQRRLGYQPLFSRNEGIKRSVQWFLHGTSE